MAEQSSKNILIVDDEKSVRDLLRDLCTILGYTTREAEDGQTALDIFTKLPPDLVITDIYMPKMNGLQLLRNIRKESPYAPVIVITGFSHYKQLACDERNRPNGCFEKPFQLIELAGNIKSLLESSASIQ